METAFDGTFGEVPEGKHCLAVMGRAGDTKYVWDPNNPTEVELAREQFNKLTRDKRFTAFRVRGKNEDRDEQMREFDPHAGRILFVPPMQGG